MSLIAFSGFTLVAAHLCVFLKTSKTHSPTETFLPIQLNSSQGFPSSIKRFARNLEGLMFLPIFFSNSFIVFRLIMDTALSGISENE